MQFAASEERDEDRARSQLGRPCDSALDIATRGLDHRRIVVGNTAPVAELAEHQARHVKPGRGPLAHEPRQPIARTQLLSSDVEFHSVEREPPRRLEHPAVRRGLEHRVHDADLHESARLFVDGHEPRTLFGRGARDWRGHRGAHVEVVQPATGAAAGSASAIACPVSESIQRIRSGSSRSQIELSGSGKR